MRAGSATHQMSQGWASAPVGGAGGGDGNINEKKKGAFPHALSLPSIRPGGNFTRARSVSPRSARYPLQARD